MADKFLPLPYIKSCMTKIKEVIHPLLSEYNDGPAPHNSKFRGLEIPLNNNFSEAIAAGTFAGYFNGEWVDIRLGDKFIFSNIVYSYVNADGATKQSSFSGAFRVADFDYFRYSGDTLFLDHHLVVVPAKNLFDACMNDTATTAGAYLGSQMKTVYLKRAEAIFRACFGSHLVTHRDIFTNAVTNGFPSGRAWSDSVCELMDEKQLIGSTMYQTYNANNAVNIGTTGCKQFNIFRNYPGYINNRQTFWLRNVVSEKSTFQQCTNTGIYRMLERFS